MNTKQEAQNWIDKLSDNLISGVLTYSEVSQLIISRTSKLITKCANSEVIEVLQLENRRLRRFVEIEYENEFNLKQHKIYTNGSSG